MCCAVLGTKYCTKFRYQLCTSLLVKVLIIDSEYHQIKMLAQKVPWALLKRAAVQCTRSRLSTQPSRHTTSSKAEKLLSSGEFKGIKFTHLSTFPMRWIDADMMGHVNNAAYFTYFEQVRCEAFEQMGLKIGLGLSEGPIIASTHCKFRGPVEFPDVLTVGAVSEQTGDCTWVQKYAVVAHSTGRVVAEGEAELVWYDYKSAKKKAFSTSAKGKLFGTPFSKDTKQ